MLRSLLAALLVVAAPAAAQVPPRAAPEPPPPAQGLAAEEVARWPAPEARQGAAVDAEHFYAIVNCRIGKYRKTDGVKVAEWLGDRIAIRHVNSCVVAAIELVRVSSIYPETPMASSVEVFDTRTMQHLR
jgi:hypothetical protein